MNTRTRHVSPQYHVVFYDDFATVPPLRNGTVPPFWKELVKARTVCVTNEQFDTSATWDMPTSKSQQATPEASEPAQSAAHKGDMSIEVADSAAHKKDNVFHMPQMVDLQSA
eukprot:2329994-Ditylum_brightwellii.AAC.1